MSDAARELMIADVDRLLIVTPARNEARHLELLARSMAAQERPPDLWIIVDDESTDGTSELMDELCAEVPFLRACHKSGSFDAAVRDRLALGAAAHAFNAGLASVPHDRFDFIGKIDGDVTLPGEYFRLLLGRFHDEPSLGIAGGTIFEQGATGRWRPVRVPTHHVPGALKLYRRECLVRIGGLRNTLGWDTVDEMYARMLGYTTRSFSDLKVLHHRRTGARAGVVRGKARHGACAWTAHYPAYFVVGRGLKLALTHPVVISGIAFLYGYAKAALTTMPRVEDEAFRSHVRRELAGRMPRLLRGLARRFWT